METDIFIASDHAGFELKNALIPYIVELGYTAKDIGAFTLDANDDYPDFITPCAQLVARKAGSFGVIIGGSGQGEAMAANRIVGIRAAVFYGAGHAVNNVDTEDNSSVDGFDIVRLARQHNNANILSLGARFVSIDEAKQVVKLFLATSFPEKERHQRRIAKF